MVLASEEMRALQGICPRATTVIGGATTRTPVLKRLRNHWFAHIVCHGILELAKPFDSSLQTKQTKAVRASTAGRVGRSEGISLRVTLKSSLALSAWAANAAVEPHSLVKMDEI